MVPTTNALELLEPLLEGVEVYPEQVAASANVFEALIEKMPTTGRRDRLLVLNAVGLQLFVTISTLQTLIKLSGTVAPPGTALAQAAVDGFLINASGLVATLRRLEGN